MKPLTRRETEALRLVADGLQDKEIARVMSITVGTAKFYMQQIYRKLDARHRANAVYIALREGML